MSDIMIFADREYFRQWLLSEILPLGRMRFGIKEDGYVVFICDIVGAVCSTNIYTG